MEQVQFTAPVGSSNKNENVELIPQGFQLCTLYGMVDIGTQQTKFGLKRQIILFFEFPMQMREFYEGEGLKPSMVNQRMSLSMAQKSTLRSNYVEKLHRKMTDKEAESYNIPMLLGKHCVATISHNEDNKNDKTYTNIDSIVSLDATNCKMFGLAEPRVNQIHPTLFFHLSQGFNSPAFGNLYSWLRETLKESQEGMKHAKEGGAFAEPTEQTGNSPKLKMIATDFTYEQYIASGWTDAMLISNGKAKIDEATPPPVPAGAPSPQTSNAPTAPPQAPFAGAPAPTVTSAPLPSTPPGVPKAPGAIKPKKLVFKDPGHTLAAFLEEGWTEEMIVKANYAHYVDVDSANPHEDDDVPF